MSGLGFKVYRVRDSVHSRESEAEVREGYVPGGIACRCECAWDTVWALGFRV